MPQLYPENGTIILPRYALLLDNLIEAVVVENPGRLDLSILNLDLISSIGRFQYSPDLLEQLAELLHTLFGLLMTLWYCPRRRRSCCGHGFLVVDAVVAVMAAVVARAACSLLLAVAAAAVAAAVI